MSKVSIPIAVAAIADSNGAATPQYYRFFRETTLLISSISDEIDAVKASIPGESQFSKNANVLGIQSIVSQGNLKSGIVLVHLDGDVDRAPALSFYGALDAGGKGWWNFSANFHKAGSTLDLVTLADTGLGTFKLITRDTWGRITGTKAGSAADVPYNNTASGLAATNVQSAIDEIADGGASSVNYAVNGAFDVWQRGTSFPSVPSATPIADCWLTYLVGSTMSVTRQDAVGSGLPSIARYFCRCNVTAGGASASVAQLILRVNDVHQFAGKKMGFAVMARASINTNVAVDMIQMYGNYAGASMYGVGPIGRKVASLTANVWTVIESGSVDMNVLTLPYAPDPGSDGLQVSLWMNAGSNFNKPGFVIGVNSGVYDWALLVVADGKASISRTELSDDVARCYRYYEKSFPPEVAPAQNAGLTGAFIAPQVVAASLATTLGHVPFKATKVRVPSLTLYNPSAANAQPRNVSTSTDFTLAATAYPSQDGFGVTAKSPSSSSAGQTAAFHWSADGSPNPIWNAVDPPVLPTLTLTGTYTSATVGAVYTSDLAIAGGNSVYSLTGGTGIASGSLPAGLSLSIVGSALRLSGTTTTAATSAFTVSVDSGDGQTATSAQSILVSSVIFGAGLHFDGTNGSTAFTDVVAGNTWTRCSGSASTISTAQKKFGTASFNCPTDSTSGIKATYNSGFDLLAASAFTVECFVYLTASGDRRIFCLGGTTVDFDAITGIHLLIGIYSSGSLAIQWNVGGAADGLSYGSVALNTWQHVALCLDSTSARLYLAGSKTAESFHPGIVRPTNNPIPCIGRIDAQGGGNDWVGYIDDLRIINGAALYTGSTYTVPTAPFT